MDGWIKLHRQMCSWEWYDDANVFRLFIHLLLNANHEDIIWRGVEIKRGQKFTSIKHLSEELKLSDKAVRFAISKLKKTKEIDVFGASNGTMISICKYDTYQTLEEDEGQATGQSKGKRGATNKNDKKEKKEIVIIDIASFKKSIEPFVEVYGRDMCNDFYSYWTEPTKLGTKVKFQLEETWDTKRRLERWSRNNFKSPIGSTPAVQKQKMTY